MNKISKYKTKTKLETVDNPLLEILEEGEVIICNKKERHPNLYDTVESSKKNGNLVSYAFYFVLFCAINFAFSNGVRFLTISFFMITAALTFQAIKYIFSQWQISYNYYLITDKRVLTFINKKMTSTPFENVHHFRKTIKKELLFRVEIANTHLPREKDIIINDLNEIDIIYDKINAHWSAVNPKAITKKTIQKICSDYQLKIEPNSKTHIIAGTYNSFEVEGKWSKKFPVANFTMWINLPNPLETFFELSEENKATALKKLTGSKELKTDNTFYDEAFFLQSNNIDLLTAILTKDIQQQMLALRNIGTGVWKFGNAQKGTGKQYLASSKYKDQDDILDFQLLDQSTTKDDLITTSNWDVEKLSKLSFTINIHPQNQTSGSSLKKLLTQSFENLLGMADLVQDYHNQHQQ